MFLWALTLLLSGLKLGAAAICCLNLKIDAVCLARSFFFFFFLGAGRILPASWK